MIPKRDASGRGSSSATARNATALTPVVRAQYHGDAATKTAVLATIDFRIREPLRLTTIEQSQLVAFLKSLTDPAARDMSSIAPANVPSGLSVKD